MGKETPRKRSKDYQRVEIEALLQFVANRKHDLFGTGEKGSSKEEKMKERTWKRATQSLRAAGGQEREWQTLRKKWRDMASKAKAYKAPRTGGGPPPEHNEIHERVLAILAREIVDGILPEEDEQNSQDSQATDLSGYQPPQPKHPQPQPPEPQPNQHQPHQPQPDMLAQRPAQIRQLEIQEELLRIQRDKLKVKQKQVNISEAILEELRSIKNMLAIKPTAIDLLNSTQQGRY